MNPATPSHVTTHRSGVQPLSPDLLRVGSRRWFLQTGLAGLAGLTLPDLLRIRASEGATRERRSVILFWLSGGPSHLDMWDPKPDAPVEIRGPYQTIATSVPGVRFCEHLPLQARLMDKLTVIRSVDCTASDHTPITMQAGNPLARRTNDGRDGGEARSRRITPSDLAATVFRHLDIPLDAQWTNPQGRPVPIVTQGGQPIAELF